MLTSNNYSDWLFTDRLIKPNSHTDLIIDTPYANIIRSFSSKKIYIQVEPNDICKAREYLLKNWNIYKYIITHDEILLEQLPNAVRYLFGGCWIPKSYYEDINVSLKKFQISSLIGFKDWTIGHRLRHELYSRQNELSRYPIKLYRSNRGNILPEVSNNPVLPNDDKVNLFEEYMFSIIIENVKDNTWFTEKLIDCLITKTIPIYWGCSKISEHFDTTGWILFDSIDELTEKLTILDETYYDKYKDVIIKNYETAKLYTDIHENLNRAIRTIRDW